MFYVTSQMATLPIKTNSEFTPEIWKGLAVVVKKNHPIRQVAKQVWIKPKEQPRIIHDSIIPYLEVQDT